MQKRNMEFVLDQAQHEKRSDKFGKAVADSIEVGIVVPSILERNLTEAGFKVAKDKADLKEYGLTEGKFLQRVIIADSKGIIAMGAAVDHAEALLASVLGYFREHPVGDLSKWEPEAVGIVAAPENPHA